MLLSDRWLRYNNFKAELTCHRRTEEGNTNAPRTNTIDTAAQWQEFNEISMPLWSLFSPCQSRMIFWSYNRACIMLNTITVSMATLIYLPLLENYCYKSDEKFKSIFNPLYLRKLLQPALTDRLPAPTKGQVLPVWGRNLLLRHIDWGGIDYCWGGGCSGWSWREVWMAACYTFYNTKVNLMVFPYLYVSTNIENKNSEGSWFVKKKKISSAETDHSRWSTEPCGGRWGTPGSWRSSWLRLHRRSLCSSPTEGRSLSWWSKAWDPSLRGKTKTGLNRRLSGEAQSNLGYSYTLR